MWHFKRKETQSNEWDELAPILGSVPLGRLVFIGVFLTITTLALGIVRILTVPDSPLVDLVATTFAFVVATFLFYRGERQYGSHIVLLTGFIGTFAVGYSRGGLSSVSMHWACFVPLLSILLIGIRGSVFYTIASVAATIVIAVTGPFDGPRFSAVMGTTLFATTIGYIFESTRLRHLRALSKLASVDRLTDLPTRSVFDSYVRNSIEKAARKKRSFFLFFLEIENYAELVETYGVYAGETALAELARRLRAVERMEESVFHLSENRFALVTPVVESLSDSNAAETQDRLERIGIDSIVHENFSFGIKLNIASAVGNGNTDVRHLLLEGDSSLHENRHAN